MESGHSYLPTVSHLSRMSPCVRAGDEAEVVKEITELKINCRNNLRTGSSNFLRLFRPFPQLASPIPPRSPPASVRQTHNACCGRLKSGHSSLAMPCHMLQRHNIPIAPTYCGRLDFGRRNLPAAPAVRAAGARSCGQIGDHHRHQRHGI